MTLTREEIDRTMAEALLDGLVAGEHIDSYSLLFNESTQRYQAEGQRLDAKWETGSNVYAFYAAEQLARSILYQTRVDGK